MRPWWLGKLSQLWELVSVKATSTLCLPGSRTRDTQCLCHFAFELIWSYANLTQVFGSVQSLSCVQLFATPWTTTRQVFLSTTNSRSPDKPMSIVSVMPSNNLILCHPLLLLPQSFPASGSFQISQLFASGGQTTSVPPMNTQDQFPLGWTCWISLQSKGLFNSLLQYHSSKASILRRSALFIVQLSHPYMTTGRTIALTRQTFVDKVMSLLLNVLSRLVITLLPRSKCLLISSLQSASAVILEPRKIKSATVSTVSPSICHLAKQLNNKFRQSKITSISTSMEYSF